MPAHEKNIMCGLSWFNNFRIMNNLNTPLLLSPAATIKNHEANTFKYFKTFIIDRPTIFALA